MEISSVDKDPATTYRHYHDRGLIIALYDNEGTLSGFQFPLVDETLPLSSPLATFKEAPRGEIYQDPSVAQNPLVRHTLSEYRIDPARLVHAGSYYKGIDESGDEWIRIALRDRVDLSRLHKYPRKIINSVLEACAILASAALITILFFSDLAPDIPYAFLFPLLFDVVAGVYVWNNI